MHLDVRRVQVNSMKACIPALALEVLPASSYNTEKHSSAVRFSNRKVSFRNRAYLKRAFFSKETWNFRCLLIATAAGDFWWMPRSKTCADNNSIISIGCLFPEHFPIDWCCFYYFMMSSLESEFSRISLCPARKHVPITLLLGASFQYTL